MAKQETLQDRLTGIHKDHPMAIEEILERQRSLSGWEKLGAISAVCNLEALRKLRAKKGIAPDKIARVEIVHPEIIMVDDRIPNLCSAKYLRADGKLEACGGIRHKMSACPDFAPKPEETRRVLSDANAVVVVQAEGLTEYNHQGQLHRTLLKIENGVKENNFEVVGSWVAGPCRICPECLNDGDCRAPNLRRYSMEGSSIGVFLTCARIAGATGDENWKLDLIRHWGLPNQSSQTFKSVVALAVR